MTINDPISNEEKDIRKPYSWLGAIERGIADSPPEMDLEVVEIVGFPFVPVDVAVEEGVATGEVGEYVTPFMPAATWKTEPPPYS